MSVASSSVRGCDATSARTRSVSLPVVRAAGRGDGGGAFPHSPVRRSRSSRWRAITLILVHVIFVVHLVQWLVMGLTLSPIEPSESMYTLEMGELNAGFVFFVLAILSTLVFGRFFCGWGCHIVALQDLCSHWMTRLGVRPRPFRTRLLVWAPVLLAFYMFVMPTLRREVMVPLIRWFARTTGTYLFEDVAPAPLLATWVRQLQPILPYWMGEAYPFPGFENAFLTEDFWKTFAHWTIAIPFVLVCTFGIVYFMGSKAFCSFGCPYGGLFGPADRVSIGRIVVSDACHGCGHCTATCTSNVRVHQEVRDFGMVVDPGCMKCMDCVSVCPNNALSFKFARPSMFAKARTPEARAGRTRRPEYDLTTWQEVGVFLVALGGFLSWRLAFNQVPMLMAVALGAISGFVAWKLWSMATTHSVRLQSLQLKVKGRVTRTGWVFAMLAGAYLLCGGWLGLVRSQRWWAENLDSRVDVAQEVVFSPGYEPGERDRRIAERSVAAFERALRWGWNLNPAQWTRKSWMHAVAGDLTSAEEALITGMQLGKPTEQLVIGLRTMQALQGEGAAEFRTALERVVSMNPQAWNARAGLGYTLAGMGERDAALGHFRSILESSEGRDTQSLQRAASALVQLGLLDEAVTTLERLAKERPRRSDLHDLLAAAYLASNRPADAASSLERAVARSPRNILYWRRLAEVRGMIGQRELAQQASQAADALERQRGERAR